MQVVLYTDDMEAITVIDLPLGFIEKLQEGRFMQVAVQMPVSLTPPPLNADFADFPTVTIWTERFIRKGKVCWFMFTRDEEAALLLRSDVLPGQRKDYQEQYRRGFINGLFAAVGY